MGGSPASGSCLRHLCTPRAAPGRPPRRRAAKLNTRLHGWDRSAAARGWRARRERLGTHGPVCVLSKACAPQSDPRPAACFCTPAGCTCLGRRAVVCGRPTAPIGSPGTPHLSESEGGLGRPKVRTKYLRSQSHVSHASPGRVRHTLGPPRLCAAPANGARARQHTAAARPFHSHLLSGIAASGPALAASVYPLAATSSLGRTWSVGNSRIQADAKATLSGTSPATSTHSAPLHAGTPTFWRRNTAGAGGGGGGGAGGGGGGGGGAKSGMSMRSACRVGASTCGWCPPF